MFGGKTSNQKKLETLRQRAVVLGRKRDEAKSALEEAAAARQRHHLEGDLEDAKVSAKLQAAVDSAASTLRGLEDAVAALSPQVAEVEQQLGDEQQRAERRAASEKLDLEIEAVRSKLAPWLAATREFAALWEKLAVLRFEAGALSRYLTNAAGEAEVAAGVTLADLAGAARAIGDGREPIPRPPPVLIAAPVPPPEATKRYYVLQPGLWRDRDGTLRTAQRHTIVELPLQVAAIALKTKPAGICSLDDPIVADFKNKFGKFGPPTQMSPEHFHCWDWNTGAAPSNDPELMAHHGPGGRAVFTPLDRGPVYSMKAPLAPAAASRSITTGERDE